MLSKAEIARYLNKEVNASKGDLVQFFHSTFYKEGLNEGEYLSLFNSFMIDLKECMLKTNDFSLDDTFLKGRTFTTLKIPKKVLKQMELDYLEAQAYIEQVIRDLNDQD
jgi:hypothetical protein